MGLSDTSIRNPVFSWMLMIGLMVLGALSFSRMGVSQLPDVDFPVVTLTLNLEGAAPEVMETTVVDPLEDALMSIQGIRSINSSSKNGSANITAEFELNRDIDLAVQEIQTKVAQTQRLLPKDMDPPIITKTNPDDQPIMWLAVTTTKSNDREFMTYVRDVLKDKFTTIEGVGDLILGGYTDPNLRVWLDLKKLETRRIAVNDVINAINVGHNEIPGGQIQDPIKIFNVRTLGEAKSPKEFGQIIIDTRGGQLNQNFLNLVHLEDVAKVEEGLADVKRLSRFQGEKAIGLGVRKQKGSNAVDVAKRVKQKMEEIKGQLPEGMQVRLNFDTTRFIEDTIHELYFTLILSAILTALACWLFLGSWSATINVILAIPTSILGAFIALYFLNFTLNTFTLLALSLAIGIVVDDSIMVLENIFRHRELGKNRIEGAIIGAREITFAALAATIAIIAIFLPVAFMKGVIGKYFFQFGVTISFTVFLSLIEALTITPMRCSQFVDVTHRTTFIGRGVEFILALIKKIYEKTLAIALNWRWIVIFASTLFLVGSYLILTLLNKEFSPTQDQSLFLVRIQTPVGSSINYTDTKLKEIEAAISKREEISQYYASLGGMGGGGSSDTNTATLFISMKPFKERPINPKTGKFTTQQDFMTIVRSEIKKIKDVKPVIQDLSTRGFTASRGFPIEFTVQGPDWAKLHEYSEAIMKKMEETNIMTDIDSNYLLGMPEIQIHPDRTKAGQHGLTFESIGKSISALIGGIKVGQFEKDGRRFDIRLQVQRDQAKVENIKNLLISNNRSNLIPLSQVITQEVKPSLQQISRIDRQRAITVYANMKQGSSQQIAIQKVIEIGKSILPQGYNLVFSGSAQTFKESFDSLIFALFFGILIAYMVLASQFNSFIDPISVLLALPFSVSGAFIALYLGNQSLNIYSMIGLILLMGIVKKNSILLVEFTNVIRDNGETDIKKALLTACPIRLRPIIMTSFATIVGAIPPALAIGPGAETRIPMAIAIIGGVIVSTLLTLYVVPCAYSLLSKFQKRTENAQKIRSAFKNTDGVQVS